MIVLICCGRRTLIARKAMRRRIAENSEMSGMNYFQQEAAKDMSLRNSTQTKIPQYAEFEVDKPMSPDRLPLNPSQTHLIANTNDRNGSDRSGETFSTEETLPGAFKVGLPSGPSPYTGGQYPPPVRMPRPYAAVPPVRTPADRRYPPGPGMTVSRSNVSLNSTNRPPRSGYEVPLPPPSLNGDRHASSVYSEYVPPRRAWGPTPPASRGADEDYSEAYRPERPKIDTYNLNREDPVADNPYVAPRPEIDPVLDRAPNRRTSESVIASYYEDVDPRFDDTAEDELEVYRNPVIPRRQSQVIDEPLPISPIRRNYSSNSLDQNRILDDEYRSGPRSPAASTSSHFTSVSQRGINPRWQPQPSQFQGNNDMLYPPRRKPPRGDQMNFLSGNPDFELPVSRSGKRVGPTVTPLDGGGRYPVPR
jgi:hypothetical protein